MRYRWLSMKVAEMCHCCRVFQCDVGPWFSGSSCIVNTLVDMATSVVSAVVQLLPTVFISSHVQPLHHLDNNTAPVPVCRSLLFPFHLSWYFFRSLSVFNVQNWGEDIGADFVGPEELEPPQYFGPGAHLATTLLNNSKSLLVCYSPPMSYILSPKMHFIAPQKQKKTFSSWGFAPDLIRFLVMLPYMP